MCIHSPKTPLAFRLICTKHWSRSPMCHTVGPTGGPPASPAPPSQGWGRKKRGTDDQSIMLLVQRRGNTVNCLWDRRLRSVRLQSWENLPKNTAPTDIWELGFRGVFSQIFRTDKNDSLCLNCLHKQNSLFWTPAFILESEFGHVRQGTVILCLKMWSSILKLGY